MVKVHFSMHIFIYKCDDGGLLTLPLFMFQVSWGNWTGFASCLHWTLLHWDDLDDREPSQTCSALSSPSARMFPVTACVPLFLVAAVVRFFSLPLLTFLFVLSYLLFCCSCLCLLVWYFALRVPSLFRTVFARGIIKDFLLNIIQSRPLSPL